MEFAANNFAFSLIRASQAMGTLLDVARLLRVEPKQVYRWIADLDRPSDERRCELEERLRAVIAPPLSD